MLEEGLVIYLSGNGELTGLIGDRLYPLALPQKPTMPAVVYQEIDAVPGYTHSGDSELEQVRMQFKCWANTLLIAKQVKAVLKRALSGFSGDMGGEEVVSFIEGGSSGMDGEIGLSFVMLDAMIWHQE
jgi:hypothetical protein